jgi:hypothetical protein
MSTVLDGVVLPEGIAAAADWLIVMEDYGYSG